MHKENFMVRRGQPLFLFVGTIIAIIVASTPISVPAISDYRHNRMINSTEYKQKYGYWQTIELPEEFRINTIHAAMLPTGKVMLVAGSGNDQKSFNEYYENGNLHVLKTVLFNPATNEIKAVDTPSDLFCSGHAFLQSGNLLVAGGTSGYELLSGEVKKSTGVITLHNEDPDSKPVTYKKGTKFISEKGMTYISKKEVTVDPATKIFEEL